MREYPGLIVKCEMKPWKNWPVTAYGGDSAEDHNAS